MPLATPATTRSSRGRTNRGGLAGGGGGGAAGVGAAARVSFMPVDPCDEAPAIVGPDGAAGQGRTALSTGSEGPAGNARPVAR